MPSEKAMQISRVIGMQTFVETGASLIDEHTAEALAEHQRVLDECKSALTWFECRSEAGSAARQIALDTLAAIAKLKGKQG